MLQSRSFVGDPRPICGLENAEYMLAIVDEMLNGKALNLFYFKTP